MAMIGENQVRNFFVVNTSDEVTLPDILAGTDLDGAVVQSDGTAAAAGEDFMLATRNNRSEATLSDIINPASVTYGKSVLFAPRVAQTYTVSALTADINTLYEIRVIFSGYGSLSVENEYTVSGFYKSKTGDDQEDIVDGLVANLARNAAKEQPNTGGTFTYNDADGNIELPDNLYLAFTKTGTGATAALVVTEKADYIAKYYVTGKKDRLNLDFQLQANFTTDPTIVGNVSDPGHGTGYHIRNMEYYFLGNRADTFRGMGYPHNFEQVYDSVLTTDYYLIELGYYSEGRDDPMKSKKQLTIACPDKTAANKMIAELNTALTNNQVTITVFA